MPTFNAGATIALSLDKDDTITWVGSGDMTVTPVVGAAWAVHLEGSQTYGPFGQSVGVSILTKTNGSYTHNGYFADAGQPVMAIPSPLTGVIEITANGQSVTQDRWYGLDCPCNDGAGLAKDQSELGLDLTPAASAVAGLWANAGYITTTAGANGFAHLPASRLSFDLQTDSFFFACKLNIAAPGANQSIIGCSTSATYGFYLSARQGSNGLVPIFYANGGTFLGTTYDARINVCDGTDHNFMLAYDAPSRSIFLYKDGNLAYAFHNALPITGPSPTTYGLTLGANYNATGATAFAGKFAGVKFRVFKGGGLPRNINQLARKIHRAPLDELRFSEIQPVPKKRLVLAWLGQSNEFGSCSDFYPARTARSGWPSLDPQAVGSRPFDSVKTNFPTLAAATVSSWHPKLSDLVGQRGVALTTMPTAIGTTCITQYWVGQISAWAATTIFAMGAYVLANGNIYKITASTNATSTNIATTGATAPTWPGAGSVVDSEATWTFIRAATAADQIGIVTRQSDLFDPNGKLAIIKQTLDNYPVGDKMMAISIGQGDKTVGATAALYQAAILSAADWAAAQGYKVIAGLTMSGTTAGMDAWLTSVGQVGRAGALSANSALLPGADLRAALGALTVTTTDIGVGADQLHGNHWAMDAAAAAWDSALAAAGY